MGILYKTTKKEIGPSAPSSSFTLPSWSPILVLLGILVIAFFAANRLTGDDGADISGTQLSSLSSAILVNGVSQNEPIELKKDQPFQLQIEFETPEASPKLSTIFRDSSGQKITETNLTISGSGKRIINPPIFDFNIGKNTVEIIQSDKLVQTLEFNITE